MIGQEGIACHWRGRHCLWLTRRALRVIDMKVLLTIDEEGIAWVWPGRHCLRLARKAMPVIGKEGNTCDWRGGHYMFLALNESPVIGEEVIWCDWQEGLWLWLARRAFSVTCKEGLWLVRGHCLWYRGGISLWLARWAYLWIVRKLIGKKGIARDKCEGYWLWWRLCHCLWLAKGIALWWSLCLWIARRHCLWLARRAVLVIGQLAVVFFLECGGRPWNCSRHQGLTLGRGSEARLCKWLATNPAACVSHAIGGKRGGGMQLSALLLHAEGRIFVHLYVTCTANSTRAFFLSFLKECWISWCLKNCVVSFRSS